MTDLKDVLAWMEQAETLELVAVADVLIDRDFACHPDDVEDASAEWGDDEPDIDPDALSEAEGRLRRREYREALHHLVRALGPDFDALENIPLDGAA